MIDKSHSRLQYRESIESAGEGIEEEQEQEQVVGTEEAPRELAGAEAHSQLHPVVETQQQDDSVSQPKTLDQ